MRMVNFDAVMHVIIRKANELQESGKATHARLVLAVGRELQAEYESIRVRRCPECQADIGMPWEEEVHHE